jgi:DNA-binding beta-propeller fold protein YncE
MWGAFGTGPGEFYYLRDIAVGPDGTVFVVDGFNRVQYFGPAGEYLGVFGSPGINAGEFHSPSGIAVGPDGSVFVADTQNHRIQFFRRR